MQNWPISCANELSAVLCTHHRRFLSERKHNQSQVNTVLVLNSKDLLISRGTKGGAGPPRFLAGPLLAPPVLCLISRSNSFD